MQANNNHEPIPVELSDLSGMERLRNTFKSKPAYAPVNTEARDEDEESYNGSDDDMGAEDDKSSFSWIEYCIFMLLGVAMLWAW